ncbi:MAG TPA: hypothetical protein VD886_16460 [Herpetosiphonaceae bacterium]|nr:hypothetical protein [Herpetosiphonaceae bacterium]
MKHILLIAGMVALGIIALAGAPPAVATGPTMPPCIERSFPMTHSALLVSSKTWGLLKDWTIQGVGWNHCQYERSSIFYDLRQTAISVMVRVPEAYGSKHVPYDLQVNFFFDGGLINDAALYAELAELEARIATFEQDPLIEQFLAIAAAPVIRVSDPAQVSSAPDPQQFDLVFELVVDRDNHIVYDPASRRPGSLALTHPALIANKELFVPWLGTSPVAREFASNVGIAHVEVLSDIDLLVITQKQPSQCATCGPWMHVNLKTGAVDQFTLPAKYPWASLPMLGLAQAAIERQGYDRQTPACSIDRGDHGLLSGNVDVHDGKWNIDVTVECADGTQKVNGKTLWVQVHADGTAEQPRLR